MPGPQIALEPKAIEILKAASARLAAARSMSFTAVVSYENPSRLGPPLVYTTRSDVLLQRPDKLRVITPGDGPASEFYYDGKLMMAYAPAENLLAVADAPPTIDAALLAAYNTAAIYFPFTDVIVADPYADIADGLRVAFYIGQSTVVGGATTDIVAYALTMCSCRSGSAPTTSCRAWRARSTATIARNCATRWNFPTGSSTLQCRPMPLRRRMPTKRRASNSSIPEPRRSPGAKPPVKRKPAKTQ